MPLSVIPEFPAIGDAAFNSKAFAFATAMTGTVRPEINALETNVNAKEASAIAEAAAAAASATFAALSASQNDATGTSTSSVLIGLGAKTFTTQTGRSWVPGQVLTCYFNGSNTMTATVTSYAASTLIVGVTAIIGSGTRAVWSIFTPNPLLKRLPIFSASSAIFGPLSSLEQPHNSSINTLLQSNQIVQNGALFVASGVATGANVQTSPDGITWTLRQMPSTIPWLVSTDGSGFMGIDRQTGTLNGGYSAAGTSWAFRGLPGGAVVGLLSAFAGISGGRYIYRGSASTTTIHLTTNNGTSWTTETAPVANMNTIFSTSGLFFGPGAPGTYYTSTTGATGSWTTRTLPATCNAVSQDYDGSMLAYSSALNCNVYRSTDGVAWTDLGFVQQNGGAIASINGVYFQAGGANSYTLHGSMWATRSTFSNLSLTAGLQRARLGNVHFHLNTGNVNGLLIDATAANAVSAFFA